MIKETDGDEFEDMRSLNQELTFEEAKKAFDFRGLAFQAAQMRTLGLLNEENIYTNLALLLSDQCPHIIKAATFRGNTQDEFQDRKEFSGSLLKQLNDACSYLDMRNQTKASFMLRLIESQGEVSRKEIENYLGISTSTAVRLMKKLSNSGLIRIVGKGKNVRYTVK